MTFMKTMFAEFKKFALKGSVIDLAVGIIIGAAFNSIVQSLVNDVIMPPIGFLIGNVDFREFFIVLGRERFETLAEAQAAGVATINYGIFINALISFIIIAFSVFILVRIINRMRERQQEAPKATKTMRPCPFCMSDISRKATRCPNCTSKLDPHPEEAETAKA